MIVWIDAQFSPALAPWLNQAFGVPAYSTRHLGLQFAKDREIFLAAREANAIVLTKDRDFVLLLEAAALEELYRDARPSERRCPP